MAKNTKFVSPFSGVKYFKKFEFDSPDVKNSGILMDPTFIKKLDLARNISNIPYVVSSGFRTEMHNKLVGGENDSSHLKGIAVDIAYKNSNERMLIIKGLILAGFVRIRVYELHIHVDLDTKKIQNWFGVKGNFV